MNGLSVKLQSGAVRCLRLGKNYHPISKNWGKNLVEYDDSFEPLSFGIGTNSFEDDFSVIDVDLTKGADHRELLKKSPIYQQLVNFRDKTLVENSKSLKGNIHIYVQNDLRMFKKSTKISPELTVEIYPSTQHKKEHTDGFYIIPTFRFTKDGTKDINNIEGLESWLESIGCQVDDQKSDEDQELIELAESLNPQSFGKPELIEIKRALDCIPNDGDTDYNTWLQVGMAVHEATNGSSEGYGLWSKWSDKSPKSGVDKDNEYTWSSFDDARRSKVTAGTLFMLARDNGYVPPIDIENIQKPGKDLDFPEIPKEFHLVEMMDVMAGGMPLSMSFYLFASVISGVIGRCYRTGVRGRPSNGSVGIISLNGAPTGAGKDTLMDLLRDPIEQDILPNLKKTYARSKHAHSYQLKKYHKEVQEIAENTKASQKSIDEGLARLTEPLAPVNPDFIEGTVTPNGLRVAMGQNSGHTLILSPEFKSMYDHSTTNIMDWSAVWCGYWSGKNDKKRTAVSDSGYSNRVYCSLSAFTMDQPSTFHQLMANDTVAKDGVLCRSFVEIYDEDSAKDKQFRTNDEFSKHSVEYKDFITFCTYYIDEVTSTFKDPSLKPYTYTIGDKSMDYLEGFKDWVKYELDKDISSLPFARYQLTRAFENTCRLYVVLSSYKNCNRISGGLKDVTVDDPELAKFCIAVVKYNLNRCHNLFSRASDIAEGTVSELRESVLRFIERRGVGDLFSIRDVSNNHKVRESLTDVKKKTKAVRYLIDQFVEEKKLTKNGNKYCKL